MGSALIPVNQFNAIPMLSATQYAGAVSGEVEVINGKLTRYFSPAATGINEWPANFTIPPSASFAAVSSLMDVRGWFLQAGGGSLVNLATLTSEGRNRIEQNIRSSFHAFHDQDSDGHHD